MDEQSKCDLESHGALEKGVNPIDAHLARIVSSFSHLSTVEKWQVISQVAQTIILFLTLIAAICIGVQQNRINQALYDIQTTLSIEVKEYSYGKFQVVSRATQDLWFLGIKVGNENMPANGGAQIIAKGEAFTDCEIEDYSKLDRIIEREKSVVAEINFKDSNGEQYFVMVRLTYDEGSYKCKTVSSAARKR